mmetsp:Transcript_38288/g.61722  ORF Transcript_38288/g.61722 Transcript_38288/m.61722 type:complete len:109 (-) Transcript_38288:132-458(-)|eukprot:CAMPEP_0115097322 /NCGR_PEP_ID=MMETSP0227-20121206/30374_1 /TAXON_ID=89957 /ORGANISM="Polarella glacialis, Strain CCMP 1383" /LENGTH=108 /DNA_ID=CAMNT_0002491473 /DNA_START=154 /DNA_END=480 /DNA_ORIENTATION=-
MGSSFRHIYDTGVLSGASLALILFAALWALLGKIYFRKLSVMCLLWLLVSAIALMEIPYEQSLIGRSGFLADYEIHFEKIPTFNLTQILEGVRSLPLAKLLIQKKSEL